MIAAEIKGPSARNDETATTTAAVKKILFKIFEIFTNFLCHSILFSTFLVSQPS